MSGILTAGRNVFSIFLDIRNNLRFNVNSHSHNDTMEKKSTRIRKEEIVQAAFAVLGKGGTKAFTITAIAKTAGMSEANIYRHFGGKDDIVFRPCGLYRGGRHG